jgi:class 3 adenylate cyclase/tetratricopeptide (TPR) repeat protein
MHLCPSCGEENPERFRLCGFCGTPLGPQIAPQEVRKTVTVVFCDLEGSTALGEQLDSEALREVMSRYFEEMRDALETHGGVVEKYIGDAIMAVFGLPRIREDDALRAVRAAAEMKRRLAGLNSEVERRWGVTLKNRTGVNTGEIVAGDAASGQRLVTGDTVNVAARLEQAAGAQEVLIGEPTFRLVRGSIEVEPVPPLELKGKAERIAAYRLVDVDEIGTARRRRLPFIGRDRELAVLHTELTAAATARSCRLVTIVAQAGVGKSRLLEAFFEQLEGRASCLSGRCLPYGRGITFWPLVEAVRQAAGMVDEDSPEEAYAKIARLCADEEVVDRVATAVGLDDADFPLTELMWGARKLFEELARHRPLILRFDDIHWAEPAFLDLVEHVLDTADATILLVCTTRPDLHERREWPVAPNRSLVELAPLDDEQASELIERTFDTTDIPAEVRARVISAAEGNPLFVEQLISMLIDEGAVVRDGDGWQVARDLAENLAIPGSIEALLTERLELLSEAQQAVLEPASVIGLRFVRPALEALVTDAVRPDLDAHIDALARKQLVRPDPQEPGAYRFEHILIRDATYNRLLKRRRAELHERFVAWAEGVNRDRQREVEYEEILGYHLEQAYRYLVELGPLDDHGLSIARRGAEKLATTGRRAFERGDMAAAAGLLERATALLPVLDPGRLALFPELGEAFMQIGELARAASLLEDAVASAELAGRPTLAANAQLVYTLVALLSGTNEHWEDEATEVARRAIELCEQAGDDVGLARAWRVLGWMHGKACRLAETGAALEHAIEHARKAGDLRQERRASTQYALTLVYGPTPLDQAIARAEEIAQRVEDDRQAEAAVLCVLSQLEAMRSDFERARSLYHDARSRFEELGLHIDASTLCLSSGRVELLAGDPEAAERELRRGYEHLSSLSERYLAASLAGLLAEALLAAGRVDEAAEATAITESLADEGDVDAQALWRMTRGKVLARRGSLEEAESLAREAVALAATTDDVVNRVSAWVVLAEVLLLAGRRDEAQAAVGAARELAEQKGIRAMLARLDELAGATPPAPVA